MPFDSNEKPQSFAQIEEAILAYWEKHKIFEKTLKRTFRRPPFVFYEGPPYANGKPGIHHVEARAFKDIILRYKTMRGFFVARKSGWDTHGLPTEMEVEKKLGVRSKREIEEKIGIEKFVSEAKKSVFLYKNEWERMTKRMGYWLDLERPYITMTNEYIEGLWWVFSRIAKNGYLYKDYKVLPWCPRCGTPLSSHELAQGYKTVKDESVYVKFAVLKPAEKDAVSRETAFLKDAYFLVWTTTPWTLPGNVALAVNPKARYVIVEKSGEFLILAKDRLTAIEGGYKIVKEETGDTLIGLLYEPLYKSPSLKVQISSYKVIKGDFVTTSDGTGIVHIAPAFGADDQQAGKAAGLPTLQTTDESGKMKTKGYAWDGAYFKDADPMIREDLRQRKLLYKTETIKHEYPFCWRCRSALMYLARDSWFLKTTAVKKRMMEENAEINWQPPFLKTGRFGEWLAENVDWAISRERYWGMPLPVWQCKRCNHETTIGSLEELDRNALPTMTRIWMLRHGEAKHNVKKLVGPWRAGTDAKNDLTPKGKKQVEKAASWLAAAGGVDVIVSSPLRRTKQTAEIVSEVLGGVPIEFRAGLAEYSIGDLEGMKESKVEKMYPTTRKLEEPFPAGESLRDVRARMMRELKAVASEYEGKRVLIISHGDPLWVMAAGVAGIPEERYDRAWYPKTGEVKGLGSHNWPYNKDGELDMHRPYIDKIMLRCEKCEGEMQRIREVADVWFDSGSMPYAQNPGFWKSADWRMPEGKLSADVLAKVIPYPADYIAEAVDQTRGWFYTLLAVSALLELPAPYKNVLSLGLLLDPKGEKMSKSRGNVVEPKLLFDRYGADAARWYFYTVNQPWDEKLFRESDVSEAGKRFLNILWNSFLYWKTYAVKPKFKTMKAAVRPTMLLNQWLTARTMRTIREMAEALDAYDVTRAARALEQFVTEDISHWYIRRIRESLRLGDAKTRAQISAVFGRALLDIARLSAPFVPFIAERIYREGGGREASIHLESWPKARELREEEKKLLEAMDEARRIVSLALEARAKAGIKIRQPLAELKVKFKSEKK
ncbi:MAG: class I tRNA ligase family protein [Candidatus Niyogibacteria bacterium]|nr:class I tRNA ligase family protein [Candidatus Niyogibacteria bacterium]